MHEVHSLRLFFLFICLIVIFQLFRERNFFLAPKVTNLANCYLVSKSDVQVVWVNFAWCEIASKVEKKGTDYECSNFKKLKEGPKLPSSPFLCQILISILVFCGIENNNHCVDCEVYLSNNEYYKVL